eukprot:CAMPEP_0197522988 /NCGR_PEP_ID=MMETSP1318-20131121/8016_1 /TAXON_ID=552666 /ORGANISM="Partenskyella glossopodia, Strain RCC365" /LENGTH=370 /DNA_ID=CAMNT_0043075531 /DNA_START=259 /DNA_END=1371 /DNA_ORIENTATION=+
MDAEDFSKPKRRLRIELVELKNGQTRYNSKLRRWACASGEIQKFCVKTYQNKQYPTFYNQCLDILKNKKKRTANSKDLSEDDVVFLSKYWKLPVFMAAKDEAQGEADIKKKFHGIMKAFVIDKGSRMTDYIFKIFLESMVEKGASKKKSMHKDFGEGHANEDEKKSSLRKSTKIYDTTPLFPASQQKSYGSIEAGESLPFSDEEKEEESVDIKGPLFWMFWGAVLVSVFSDPMVDMIDDFAVRIGVNPFYVSFIVTPLVSNASEVLCAYKLASKLTNKTLTVALSTLYGAAVMNSTFCMAIFTGLVYFRGLEWNYSSEVIIIVIVMFVVGGLGVTVPHQTFTVTSAWIALVMFPLSLVFVFICQDVLGMG